jgi:hypothetical protein
MSEIENRNPVRLLRIVAAAAVTAVAGKHP